jgi:hypothetical protein
MQLTNSKKERKLFLTMPFSKRTGKEIEVKLFAQLRTTTKLEVFLTEFILLTMTSIRLKHF